jgi:hypothetical protein
VRNEGEVLTLIESAKFSKKSVFELIEVALNYYQANKPLKPVSITKYQNKLNPEDVLHESDLADAWKRRINPNDYEAVTETVNPCENLKKFLYGDSKNFDLNNLDELKSVCKIINSRENSDQIEMRKAKQKVYNVAGGAITKITLGEAIEEAEAVFAKYGEVFTYKPKVKKALAPTGLTESVGESEKSIQEA